MFAYLHPIQLATCRKTYSNSSITTLLYCTLYAVYSQTLIRDTAIAAGSACRGLPASLSAIINRKCDRAIPYPMVYHTCKSMQQF